jgi:hypothetical protein
MSRAREELDVRSLELKSLMQAQGLNLKVEIPLRQGVAAYFVPPLDAGVRASGFTSGRRKIATNWPLVEDG